MLDLNQIHHGDCLQVLKTLADNSVDSIVTDPPYGLGKEPDALAMLTDWMQGRDYVPKGKGGFMGKEWDAFVPQPAIWRECLRVLKPGGHIVAFAGTRTQHLMALGLQIAGFELRDMLAWIYGSGFPKSANISKQIDKAAGAEREVVGVKMRPDGSHRPNAGQWQSGMGYQGNPATPEVATAPATDAAKQWDGFGTALKPALEPITLARKPFPGTVAANVQQHGTGALNIDKCRIGTGDDRTSGGAQGSMPQPMDWGRETGRERPTGGRWPANLLHDGSPEVLAGFPQTAPSPKGPVRQGGHHRHDVGLSGESREGFGVGYADKGSAARFFYCAKASKKDRDEGLEGFEVKQTAAMQGNTVAGQPLSGNGIPIDIPTRANVHPTVKPTDVMRWLCRLITPPGGVVLDPFTGSGSTGKAAVLEGFQFIGIEREAEYVDIARARVAAASPAPPAPVAPAPVPVPSVLLHIPPRHQLDLFALTAPAR